MIAVRAFHSMYYQQNPGEARLNNAGMGYKFGMPIARLGNSGLLSGSMTMVKDLQYGVALKINPPIVSSPEGPELSCFYLTYSSS